MNVSMFLNAMMDQNNALIEAGFALHRAGCILPDTYVIDVDAFRENARRIKRTADSCGITLYGMTKQVGRNTELAKLLLEEGYAGIVAVDFEEALTMIRAGLHLGHVGHLVQVPRGCLKTVIAARPDIMTVYSLEKAKEISECASSAGLCQPLMLRLTGSNDDVYPGQGGGLNTAELPEFVKSIRKLKAVRLCGITAFPCFQYDEARDVICKTPNMDTLQAAKEILERSGVVLTQVNGPSVNCCLSMSLLQDCGVTHAEPGHALTGTTPYHARHICPEKPAVIYVTEVSHRWNGKAMCYGGGFYRRSHMVHALVGKSPENSRLTGVETPDMASIDYHFTLSDDAAVSDTVIMAFRTQIFVTRSSVALVEGLSEGAPRLTGIFASNGQKIG